MLAALLNQDVKSTFVEKTQSHNHSGFFGRGETGWIGGDLLMNLNFFGVSGK